MKYIIPQQTILLFILLVGCEGVYTPKDDVHPIVGEWTGLEREQKLINSDGITLSTDISPYNKVWTFNLDNTFSVLGETSLENNLYLVNWNINENQLTLTAVGVSENFTTIYDYGINNNILSLNRTISYDDGDSITIILTFYKSN